MKQQNDSVKSFRNQVQENWVNIYIVFAQFYFSYAKALNQYIIIYHFLFLYDLKKIFRFITAHINSIDEND